MIGFGCHYERNMRANGRSILIEPPAQFRSFLFGMQRRSFLGDNNESRSTTSNISLGIRPSGLRNVAATGHGLSHASVDSLGVGTGLLPSLPMISLIDDWPDALGKNLRPLFGD